MLTRKQKHNFIIMLVSAGLSQLLHIAIGDLTNRVLDQTNLSFLNVFPFLSFPFLASILCVTIAHRLSTLKNTDEIFVFDKGKIVERGKFDDLKDRPGIFQDMYLGKLK